MFLKFNLSSFCFNHIQDRTPPPDKSAPLKPRNTSNVHGSTRHKVDHPLTSPQHSIHRTPTSRPKPTHARNKHNTKHTNNPTRTTQHSIQHHSHNRQPAHGHHHNTIPAEEAPPNRNHHTPPRHHPRIQ